MDHFRQHTRNRLFLFILFAFGLFSFSNTSGEEQTIEDGIFDLSGWDFKSNTYELGGIVNFYWENFLSIEEIIQDTIDPNQISLSHSWDNQNTNNADYPAKGYATYHFKILIPEEGIGQEFILRPNHFISYASQLYYNNKMISHNGYVGTSVQDNKYSPSRNTISKPFVADSSILDIVIWSANFDHFRGGVFQKIRFGLAENMIAHRESGITYDLIVIVSLLIMFIYHFILHFVNRRQTTALLFSFTCLVFAVDLSFQDTMSFFLFFPNAGFALTSFLHLSMPYLIPCTFIFFLHALFPNEVSIYIRNISGFIAIALIAVTAINIDFATRYLVKPHFAYNLLIVIYIYYVAVKAIKNKREGAVMFIIAYFIFSVFAVNDILLVYEIIYTTSMVSAGLIVFILLVSILQGRLLAKMDANNLKLTHHLKELNRDLEQKVEERTLKLNHTLEGIKELSLFKEDMTNTIIHDLKTPLNAIINAKLIEDENSRLSMVQQSGYKMLNLVQNILDVYRYESTQIELSKNKIDIYELINNAIKEVIFTANQKSITIIVNKDVRCTSSVDVNFIQRVFVNLLTNAITHSPNNGVIEIKAISFGESIVKMIVCNQGPGIPKERQHIIFEKFGQANNNKSDTRNSTGLGLTFCKIAVEAHGGEIGVVSEEDSGVEFWFTLPNSESKKFRGIKTDDSENKSLGLSDPDKAYLFQFLLELRECEIFEVSTIKSILKKIEKKSPAIEYWTSELENTVFTGDNKAFKELLK